MHSAKATKFCGNGRAALKHNVSLMSGSGENDSARQHRYNPAIFETANLDAARRIILTPEGATTEQRWATETPYLAGLIADVFPLTEHSLVLDYGCGIGRMAKELISRHGCRVVGVDISTSMRSFAAAYVGSDRFFACSPAMLDVLAERGVAFDLALSIWVLQHCSEPAIDISRIAHAVVPKGGLFVVNQTTRAVPTFDGWIDDRVDVSALLSRDFAPEAADALSAAETSDVISLQCYWAAYRRLA